MSDTLDNVATVATIGVFAFVATSAAATPEVVEVEVPESSAAAETQSADVSESANSETERVTVAVDATSEEVDVPLSPAERAQKEIMRLGYAQEMQKITRCLRELYPGARFQYLMIEEPETGHERPYLKVIPEQFGSEEWEAFVRFENDVLLETSLEFRRAIGIDIA